MNMKDLTDWIQVSALVASVAGVAYAFWKGGNEIRESRRVRQEELRWKKAELARGMMKELVEDPCLVATLTMLDWDGRFFEIEPEVEESISEADIIHGLRTRQLEFSPKERFIRDRFDSLFLLLQHVEHYLSCGLLEFEDVRLTLAYYIYRIRSIDRSSGGCFSNYISTYRFQPADLLIDRFRPLPPARRDNAAPIDHHPPKRAETRVAAREEGTGSSD